MKYRITSNGEEFRVEGSFEYTVGILWWKQKLTHWQPLTKDGNFPFTDEDGDWDDEDVEYYESRASAQTAVDKFVAPAVKVITRWNSKWKVV